MDSLPHPCSRSSDFPTDMTLLLVSSVWHSAPSSPLLALALGSSLSLRPNFSFRRSFSFRGGLFGTRVRVWNCTEKAVEGKKKGLEGISVSALSYCLSLKQHAQPSSPHFSCSKRANRPWVAEGSRFTRSKATSVLEWYSPIFGWLDKGRK